MIRKKDIRTRILAAVEREFKDKRYHELTLDAVAQSAGVGKGTIYRYFKNKEALVCHLATHGHDKLCGMLAEYGKETGVGLAELLEKTVEAMSRFYCSRHTLVRIMEQEGQLESLQHKFRMELRTRRRRLVELVAAILGRGEFRHELRNDIDLKVQANFLLGLIRARDLNFKGWKEGIPSPKTVVSLFLNGAIRQSGGPVDQESV